METWTMMWQQVQDVCGMWQQIGIMNSFSFKGHFGVEQAPLNILEYNLFCLEDKKWLPASQSGQHYLDLADAVFDFWTRGLLTCKPLR